MSASLPQPWRPQMDRVTGYATPNSAPQVEYGKQVVRESPSLSPVLPRREFRRKVAEARDHFLLGGRNHHPAPVIGEIGVARFARAGDGWSRASSSPGKVKGICRWDPGRSAGPAPAAASPPDLCYSHAAGTTRLSIAFDPDKEATCRKLDTARRFPGVFPGTDGSIGSAISAR